MASGGSATIAIVVTSPNSSGPLSNTATVVSTTPDPVTGNNTSTWTSTVTVAATQGVPALSTWGLAGLALLLAGFGGQFIRRARA